MHRVFVSYRRLLAPDATGRVYDYLRRAFPDTVFVDIHSLPLGLDFQDGLNESLKSCWAAVVIIGPGWQDMKDDQGNSRLADPDDWVRRELETLLSRAIPLIPVYLYEPAGLIRSALPDSLKPIINRGHAVIRSGLDFENDIKRVCDGLKVIIDRQQKEADARAKRAAEWDDWIDQIKVGFGIAVALILVACVGRFIYLHNEAERERLAAYEAKRMQDEFNFRQALLAVCGGGAESLYRMPDRGPLDDARIGHLALGGGVWEPVLWLDDKPVVKVKSEAVR